MKFIRRLIKAASDWLTPDYSRMFIRGTVQLFDEKGNVVVRAQYEDGKPPIVVVVQTEHVTIIKPGQPLPPLT
jgi:hypothetical protein